MNQFNSLSKDSPKIKTDNIVKSKFLNSLKPISFLFVLCGFRNLSCCITLSESSISKGSRARILGELFRIGIFLALTFIFLQRPPFYILYYDVIRYWITFLTVRSSEKSITK